MLTKTKIAILSSLAVAVVAAVAVAGMNVMNADSSKKTEDTAGGFFPPPSPIKKILVAGPVKDASEASAAVGFNVAAPSYLPQGYSIKVFRADPVTKDVAMLAWNKDVTDQTTDTEFLYEGSGIIIFMTKNPPDYNMTKVIDMWLEQQAQFGAHKITINGLPAVAHDGKTVTDDTGRQIPILAEVNFWKEDVGIKIRGNLAETELIKVAESMKFS